MILFEDSWWLLIPCVGVAVVAALLTYRYSRPRLSFPWRIALTALRTTTLLLCMALILQPVWRHSHRHIKEPSLAILVDETLSMARYDSVLQHVLTAVNDAPADLLFLGFDDGVRLIESTDSARTTGIRTDLAGALSSAIERPDTDHIRAILLLSDGQHNTGRNPLYVAAQSPLPIHTVAIGDTMDQRDLRISRIITNDIGYVGQPLPVEISFLADGYENAPIVVSLVEGGSVVDNVRTTAPADGTVLSVDLQHTPIRPGQLLLTASVTQLEGEVTEANNSGSATVSVLDNRRKILLISGGPHPDLAALQRMLGSLEASEVVTRIQKDANSWYEGPLPDSLESFDLIVLAGFPVASSRDTDLDRIASSGSNVILVLSERTELDLLRSKLAETIPAAPTLSTVLPVESSLTITPTGRLHTIFQDLPPFSAEQLPPILSHASGWQATPDALILASTSAANDPLLLLRSRNGIRSAAILGSGTWRWKNLPESSSTDAQWWPTLFDNLIQWLLTTEDVRTVRVSPIHQSFGGGERVQFSGQVFDESLQGVDDATVLLTVTAPDGAEYPYTLTDLGGGRYALDIGTLPEGSYSYTARASRNGAELGNDSGNFTVGTLSLEYADTKANVPLMRQIAHQSGGQNLVHDDIVGLSSVLRSDSAFVPLVAVETRELTLWQWPFLLALIMMLLTAEWILRKRSGLA